MYSNLRGRQTKFELFVHEAKTNIFYYFRADSVDKYLYITWLISSNYTIGNSSCVLYGVPHIKYVNIHICMRKKLALYILHNLDFHFSKSYFILICSNYNFLYVYKCQNIEIWISCGFITIVNRL